MAPKKEASAQKGKITFNYIKTHNYRTYYIDGIYGGTTPNGKIFAELFTERRATPQKITHELTQKGGLGRELNKEGKEGLIRQVEASLLMDVPTAKAFVGWLVDKINIIEGKSAGKAVIKQ